MPAAAGHQQGDELEQQETPQSHEHDGRPDCRNSRSQIPAELMRDAPDKRGDHQQQQGCQEQAAAGAALPSQVRNREQAAAPGRWGSNAQWLQPEEDQ